MARAGGLIDFCLALEKIGRIDQPLGITLEAAVGVGATPIYRFGDDEQRETLLPIATTAVADGDEWVVNGAIRIPHRRGVSQGGLARL